MKSRTFVSNFVGYVNLWGDCSFVNIALAAADEITSARNCDTYRIHVLRAYDWRGIKIMKGYVGGEEAGVQFNLYKY